MACNGDAGIIEAMYVTSKVWLSLDTIIVSVQFLASAKFHGDLK